MSRSRPRLVFHAGTHKTGTTAIQSAFRRWSDEGRLTGPVYPSPRRAFRMATDPIDHLRLVEAAARNRWRDRLRLRAFAADLRRRTRGGGTAFLSTEGAWSVTPPGHSHRDPARWWDGHGAVLRRLARSFRAFDLEFLLVLRRPETFAEALFSEAIVSAQATAPFETYIGHHPHRYAYGAQIALFRDIATTHAICYETARETGLLATVSAHLGMEAMPPVPSGEVLRQSLPKRAVEWLRREKAAGGLSRQAQQRRWRFGIEMADTPLFAGPPETFWPDAATRDAFIARSLDGFDAVRFPPAAPMAPPLRWLDKDQERATAAFAAWETRNAARLARRDAAGLRPFQPD